MLWFRGARIAESRKRGELSKDYQQRATKTEQQKALARPSQALT
jgi:hypothetical protein